MKPRPRHCLDRGARRRLGPRWRRWLGPPSRCLVPFTSFSENDRGPDGKAVPVWFSLDEARPLAFIIGRTPILRRGDGAAATLGARSGCTHYRNITSARGHVHRAPTSVEASYKAASCNIVSRVLPKLGRPCPPL